MKRLLLILLLLAPITCLGQRTASNPLGGNLTVQDAGTCSTTGSFLWQQLPSNAATTIVNLAGTFSGTLTIRLSNNGGGSWTTNSTTTSVGNTSISTNGFTDICADVTTFTSGSFGVTITTGLNTGPQGPPGPAGSGGGGGLCPSNSPTCVDVTQSPYNVKGDTQYLPSCTWTININLVTCSQAQFKASDNGKACAGITNGGVNSIAAGTFTFVTSSTAQCNTPGDSTGGFFAWGTDFTIPMQTAHAAMVNASLALGGAAPTCGGSFKMPVGMIWITQNPATTAEPATCGQFNTNFPKWGVEGTGAPGATIIFMAPNFAYTASTAGGCLQQSSTFGCLFFPLYTHFRNFAVTNLGFRPTLSTPTSGILLGSGSIATEVFMANLLPTVANFNAWNITGQNSACYYCVADGTGGNSASLAVSAQGASTYGGYFTGGTSVTGELSDFGSFFDDLSNTIDPITVSGTLHLFDSHSNSINYSGPACSIGANGVLDIYGSSPSAFGPCQNQGTGAGILFRGANGTVYLHRGVVKGGAGGFAGGGAINTNSNTGARVFDYGGTTLTGSMANYTGAWIGAGTGPNVRGSCTGTVTASSTLALRVTGTSTTGTGVASTCTSTTIDAGQVMQTSGTLVLLTVTAGTGGVNASSGAVTVLKNGASQTMTCTLGTGTTCLDGTHTIAYSAGDLISIQFTSQAADTLANVRAIIVAD